MAATLNDIHRRMAEDIPKYLLQSVDENNLAHVAEALQMGGAGFLKTEAELRLVVAFLLEKMRHASDPTDNTAGDPFIVTRSLINLLELYTINRLKVCMLFFCSHTQVVCC